MVTVLHLTQMTAISFNALGGTETLAIVRITQTGMAVALTRLTATAICGIAIVTRDAALALFAGGEVLASFTNAFIYT